MLVSTDTSGTGSYQTTNGAQYLIVAVGGGGAGGAAAGTAGATTGAGGGGGGGAVVAKFTGDGSTISWSVGRGGRRYILADGSSTLSNTGVDGSGANGSGDPGLDTVVTLTGGTITAGGGSGGTNASSAGAGAGGAAESTLPSTQYVAYAGGDGGAAGGNSASAGQTLTTEVKGTPGAGGTGAGNYYDKPGGGGGVAGFSHTWASLDVDPSVINLNGGGDGGNGNSQPLDAAGDEIDGGSYGQPGTGYGSGGGGTAGNNNYSSYYSGGAGHEGGVWIFQVNNPPNSLFYADNSEGLQFQITDLSSDPEGPISLWRFDFGTNGAGSYHGTSIVENPVAVTRYLTFDSNRSSNSGTTIAGAPPEVFYYRYNTAGDKQIVLTVTDANGVTDVSQLETALPATNLDPSAAFKYLAYRDNRNVDIIEESSDIDGTITAWEWNFGDGTTETWNTTNRPADGEFTKTYTSDGNYDISLTVTDNTGGENTITLTVDVPRVNANVVFVQSGPVSLGFSVLSGVSALDTKTQNYRGPSWLAWSRTTDLSAIDEQLRINVRKSLIPVALPPGYTQEQVKKYGYPREPYSLKFATEDAEQNYDVDFFAPADSNAPYGFNEFFGAEIPPPAVETPNPPDVAIGGGLYSVRFDNQTYFKVFIDTSGSMRAYENSYRTAANNVQAEMASVFFNNDAALARKYILPYTNIGNERWGDWAMSTLYESGEPAKQVIIAAINEDSSGGQGTPNSAILAKAQAMFDSGGHYYFILIAPPGGNSGGMFSNGPALASTRVTKGGEQIRWCQWSRETASGGALTDVIKQILGFNAIL